MRVKDAFKLVEEREELLRNVQDVLNRYEMEPNLSLDDCGLTRNMLSTLYNEYLVKTNEMRAGIENSDIEL